MIEGLIALAALAGQTVVAAAATDAWETAKRGFARLLGRGDARQEQLAEQRLEQTREQVAGSASEQDRAALADRWAGRIADLLEEDASVEADLRALVRLIQAELPAGAVSAASHAVAAGRDVTITDRVSPDGRHHLVPGVRAAGRIRARGRDAAPGAGLLRSRGHSAWAAAAALPRAHRTAQGRDDAAARGPAGGQRRGARDQCAALLADQERILGAEHPMTLLVRGNLAHWTGEAGDAAQARDLLAGLLPVYQRLLGDGHPDTLVARAALARWTEEAYAQARGDRPS